MEPALSWGPLRLGLGGNRLAGPESFGPPRDAKESHRVVHLACDSGVAVIDTADCYGPYWSERIIGEALSRRDSRPIVATKVGVVRDASAGWSVEARPENLARAAEGSLRRLRLEAVDVLQLHHPSTRIPLEDQVGALQDVRRRGLARHIGLCNVTLEQLRRAEREGPIASVQNHLHALRITPDDLRLVAYCKDRGITVMAYQPFAEGSLLTEPRVVRAAERKGVPAAQVALGVLLDLGDHVVPIPGSGSTRHVRANAEAVADHLGLAGRVSRPPAAPTDAEHL
ncbi:aldo/keto reductase [Streptomyces sp. NRRL F-2747]|uniref:aldo/keto reductase n=1 Tax=Streptomyces sp. NRRL F-2747 TaxID=1463843 RepID=UPI0007C4FA2E|nr:aldo/keto reductase [Streptomyces sp. NRRL F-2747]